MENELEDNLKEKTSKEKGINDNLFLKVFDLAIGFVLCIGFPIIASRISNYFFPFASVPWNILHHIIQMCLALIVIFLPIWNKTPKDWGFNLENQKYTWTILKKFILGYAIFYTIGTLITLAISGNYNVLWFEPTWKEFLINMSFYATMPGPSEEILFRAMFIGIISRHWKGKIKIKNIELTHANIFAAITFTIAHIGFNLVPFEITYINYRQLAFAFGLGLFYGYLLQNSKSLLGPILAHNFTDGFALTLFITIELIF